MDLATPILALFLIFASALSCSHAVVSPLVYWKTALPGTPMPSAISQLLYTGAMDEKTGTTVGVGKGGVHVNTGNGKSGDTNVDVGHGGVDVNVHGKHGKGGGTHVSVGGGGVNVHTNPKKKPVYVRNVPFDYVYAATADQVNANRDVAVFFLKKDLHAGARMNLHWTKTTSGPKFLTRRRADAMPFSSKKLPEILARFGIRPDSDDAISVASTLNVCEAPAMVGEKKACVTSLESMVDFAIASLATPNVAAVSTTVEKENSSKQVYTFLDVKKLKVGGEEKTAVACHAQPYMYAVFYCHATTKTRVYEVSMVGEHGGKVKAVAVCHTDTHKWNPRHLAFQLLGVQPGTAPVCHFLPEDHVVWIPSK